MIFDRISITWGDYMNTNKNSKLIEEEKLLVQYQILSNRRISQNELLWQVPAMSFTAQAFLFTIAFGSQIRIEARLIAAFLIIMSSTISIQLMSKNRYLEIKDSISLENIEIRLGIDTIHSKDSAENAPFLAKLKSYEVWIGGLTVFLIIGIVLFVYCLFRII